MGFSPNTKYNFFFFELFQYMTKCHGTWAVWLDVWFSSRWTCRSIWYWFFFFSIIYIFTLFHLHIYTMDPDDFWRCIIQVSALARIIIILVVRECVLLCASSFDKVPQHTSILSGQDWIDKLIAGQLDTHKAIYCSHAVIAIKVVVLYECECQYYICEHVSADIG